MIECKCDCGNVICLNYQEAYNKKFSCGCSRRNRSDYAGREISGDARKLTMLAPGGKGNWLCLCDFCGETHEYSDQGWGILREINRQANRKCPEDRIYHPLNGYWQECIGVKDYWHNRIPGGNFKELNEIAEWLAQFYEERHIKRDSSGQVIGLYGAPDKPLPPLIRALEPVEPQRLSDDPDDFGAI
jgi:hypothetical protein